MSTRGQRPAWSSGSLSSESLQAQDNRLGDAGSRGDSTDGRWHTGAWHRQDHTPGGALGSEPLPGAGGASGTAGPHPRELGGLGCGWAGGRAQGASTRVGA